MSKERTSSSELDAVAAANATGSGALLPPATAAARARVPGWSEACLVASSPLRVLTGTGPTWLASHWARGLSGGVSALSLGQALETLPPRRSFFLWECLLAAA